MTRRFSRDDNDDEDEIIKKSARKIRIDRQEQQPPSQRSTDFARVVDINTLLALKGSSYSNGC